MSDSQTPDEIRATYVQALGHDLGRFMYAYRHELLRLHLTWEQYRGLFAVSQERVDMLNDCAGLFFFVVEDALWDDVLLHLARLTDPPQTERRRRTNLSIQLLPSLIESEELRKAVRKQVSLALKGTEFVRHWRNEAGAHKRFDVIGTENAVPISKGSQQQIESSLQALRDVFHAVTIPLLDTETLFEIHGSRNFEALLVHLRAGRRALSARREQLKSGCPDPDNLMSLARP